MRRITTLVLILIAVAVQANVYFTIGSNRYLTIRAYPHDLLRWPANGTFLNYAPSSFPWQGHVTNIFSRPSESYVSNFQDIEFAPPYGFQGNPEDIHSWMKLSSNAQQNKYDFGGLIQTTYGKFFFQLGMSRLDMELTAEGVGRATIGDYDNPDFELVPFGAQTMAERSEQNVQFIWAHRLFGQPVGLKVNYIKRTADEPRGYVSFQKEGSDYHTSRLTWGWSTVGCNHIFGYDHINTDAWYQNQYILYDGYQLDIQASTEINGNFKSGFRYRRMREDGNLFDWEGTGESEIQGQYIEDTFWKHRKFGDLFRAYTKHRFIRIGNLDAGVLFFGQYATNPMRQVSKLTDSDPAYEMLENEFAIETNPFINYRFNGGYLDFGVLIEYSRANMKNVYTRWNSASQSEQKDVLWNTTPYLGWSQPWENYSKGNQWFFATGFESYASIDVVRPLSLLLRLTVLKMYTHIDNFYGDSVIPDNGTSFVFQQSHKRDTYKNETWVTGSFGFQYRLGGFEIMGTLQMPLAYLISQSTELEDNEEQLFRHEIRNTWQVQQPASFQLFLIYGWGG